MEVANVISVNPGVKTLGRLHEEAAKASELSRRLLETAGQNVEEGAALDFVLATGKSERGSLSKKLFLLRTVCGSALIGMGVYGLINGALVDESVMQIVFGASLLLGFFTRIVSIAAICLFGYEGFEFLLAGNIEAVQTGMILTGLCFGLLGAGQYSVDDILRKVYWRMKVHREKNRNEKASGYKAFHYVN